MALLANNFVFFILVSAFHNAVAQQTVSRISPGSSLSPQGGSGNSSWLSSTGLFSFGFYPQDKGYIVGVFIAGVSERKVVWIANRDDPIFPSNSTLNLTRDGRLILQRVQGQDIPVAHTDESISSASMQDSGNFVLYNSAEGILWQSFENPNVALLPGQRLQAEKQQELISSASETDYSRGNFRLIMKLDGNLVQYPTGTPYSAEYAYWQPENAPGLGSNTSLNLENDGRLYLFNSTMMVNLTNGDLPRQRHYLAKVDVDGIFRMYSYSSGQGNWSIEWNSSANKCAPKGLCGFNSYCYQEDSIANCRCLPGFDFVNQANKRLGCVRNFTTESCIQENGNVNYNTIRSLESTDWENNTYSTMEKTTREDCQKACEEDCNCEVAIFKGGICTKQSLPLRFGQHSSSELNVAFIKIGNIDPQGQGNIPGDQQKKTIREEIRLDILIISILLLGLAVVIVVISGILIYRNRLWEYKKTISQDRNGVESIDNAAPRVFTYEELRVATNDFNEELGRGAFGTVYKGVLPEFHKEVAIKKLEKVLAEGEIEFQNEVRVIGRTYHRNLVRLLGYCLEGRKRLLVYEYMSNGSLANLLFNQENNIPSWEERIGIAMDVARGILYLHEECETQIIHCDIKPQNILMDKQWCAKISDFGVAKLLKHDQTRTYTGLRGTKGYVAPEWHRRQPVTVKADVYSFGIVLLEIVCCRKSLNLSLPENEAILEEWAYACFEAGELHKLVGDEQVDQRKLETVFKIAIWCIQDEPSLRPSMKTVQLMLEGTVDIPKPPRPTSILSTM